METLDLKLERVEKNYRMGAIEEKEMLDQMIDLVRREGLEKHTINIKGKQFIINAKALSVNWS